MTLPPRESTVLELDEYGLAFDRTVVLASITLRVGSPGITLLMGPTGSGKSALLRTLAGLNDAQPSLRTWGSVRYAGRALGPTERPVMVMQHARLLTSSIHENLVVAFADRARLTRGAQAERARAILSELACPELGDRLDREAIDLSLCEQRVLAIARAYATEAPLMLLDEPAFGLSPVEAGRVIDVLGRAARRRALLVSTHNQAQARLLGGEIALLAGGRIVETGSLLDGARTEAGRQFVSTGGTSLPSPSASAEDLAPGIAPPPPLPQGASLEGPSAPRHFYWAVPELVAGTPRPGIVDEVDDDLARLAGLGITLLICLEEQTPFVERLAAHGLRCAHFPIPDMQPPSVDTARRLCGAIDAALAEGDRVAVHCLAGLGRTGTALAIYLVHRGATAVEAIERIRALRPRSIQTEAQAAFISRFEYEHAVTPMSAGSATQ